LVARDIGPCDAHELRLAVSNLDADSVRPYRGWTAEDWADATDRLRSHGWVAEDGTATGAGRAQHQMIELETDRAAARFLGDADTGELRSMIDRLRPLAARLAHEVVPYPNPMGASEPTPVDA
ncbi:MAG: helix-turn-helix domain-containing protein, partial [Acidimicrobiia bacterium]